MKNILCYGDSNTWGYDAETALRFLPEVRWTGRLQALLPPDCHVTECGLNGRTTAYDDGFDGWCCGSRYLPVALKTHDPLDLVVLMLGTNDLKKRFGMTAFTIGGGVTALVKAARLHAMNAEGLPPKILIVAPPPVAENMMETRHAPIFGEDSIAVSRELGPELRRVAKLMRCEFLDAAPYGEVSRADAVHMTREGHLRLAKALCEKVLEILK